ncbi:MAG: S8 family serine peptidase, partial [Ilumatobacteraceae bacterium]
MRKRPFVLLTAFATATALWTTGTSAQELELEPDGASKHVVESESGSYVVVMEEDPVVVTTGQDGLDTPAAESLAEDLEADQDEVLEDIGADGSDKVNTYTNALNGFSAFLSYEEAQALAADPKVALVMPDVLHQLDTNDSPEYLGLARRGGAYDSGLTGEDVVVGVIDSGIWPEHASFADDGSYGPSPIPPLDNSRPSCEFGNAGHVTDPSIGPDLPFTCNNKLLGGRQMLDTYRAFIGATPFEYDSARDDDGHGTHTASTAAGNAGVSASMYGENLGDVSGIAPRARVIAYKGLGALGGFTSDLAASIDQAVSDGVDVINYSVGGGGAVPTGADDIAFLFAADAGVFVATSAGNSGPGDDTVGSPGNAPWITTVGANTQDRFYEGEVKP